METVVSERRDNSEYIENMSADAFFEVQDSVSGGRHTLILKGELDVSPAAELEAMLTRICADGTTGIELDLSKLTFMGSTGIRVVLLAKELCERHGYEFFVVPPPRNIQRLFELTGIVDVLPIRSDDATPS
jgi:anti-sigma B factor antagonist